MTVIRSSLGEPVPSLPRCVFTFPGSKSPNITNAGAAIVGAATVGAATVGAATVGDSIAGVAAV